MNNKIYLIVGDNNQSYEMNRTWVACATMNKTSANYIIWALKEWQRSFVEKYTDEYGYVEMELCGWDISTIKLPPYDQHMFLDDDYYHVPDFTWKIIERKLV